MKVKEICDYSGSTLLGMNAVSMYTQVTDTNKAAS